MSDLHLVSWYNIWCVRPDGTGYLRFSKFKCRGKRKFLRMMRWLKVVDPTNKYYLVKLKNGG